MINISFLSAFNLVYCFKIDFNVHKNKNVIHSSNGLFCLPFEEYQSHENIHFGSSISKNII